MNTVHEKVKKICLHHLTFRGAAAKP